jgi:hypothetical protein
MRVDRQPMQAEREPKLRSCQTISYYKSRFLLTSLSAFIR